MMFFIESPQEEHQSLYNIQHAYQLTTSIEPFPIHDDIVKFLELALQEAAPFFPKISWNGPDLVPHESNISQMLALATMGSSRISNDIRYLQPTNALKLEDIFLKEFWNPSIKDCKITVDGRTYVVPSNSRFVISDFKYLPGWLRTRSIKYDFVCMDPPWQNTSRGVRYDFLDPYELFKIPIKQILSPNRGLVGVWVTNKTKYHRFVLEKLFPFYGLVLMERFVWLKVTNDGVPLFPLYSKHRKPFEVFYIGSNRTDPILDVVTTVLVSVPSKLHSTKPSLSLPMESLLPTGSINLELFARKATKNFTSWGNETIAQNDSIYYA